MKRLALTLLLLLLAACSMPPERPREPTIADLEQPLLDIEPSVLTDISPSEVRRSYEDLAATTSDPTIKAIALERIGDLKLEEQEAQSDTARGKDSAPPTADYERVIADYRNLLQQYPGYPGNARVLYQLAKAYELKGDLDRSLETLDRLVHDFPTTPYFDEAQFRRGEILFSLRDYEAAQEAYAAILARGAESQFYDRALYKHGWSQFKRSDLAPTAALESFSRLLDRSFTGAIDGEQFAQREAELVEDTLRVLSVIFSLQQGADSVQNFFAEHGRRPYEYRVYQRLAELYLKQERPEDAITAYRRFVQLSPQHPQAPYFQLELIGLYTQTAKPAELIAAKADFVRRYTIDAPFWDDKRDALKTAMIPHLKAHTRDVARHFHALAQKSKKPQDYAVAGQWYRRYVNSFPQDIDTPHMNFLLAETLFEAGDLVPAAAQYHRTAYEYPQHPDSAEAGYAAVLAINKLADRTQGEARGPARLDAIGSAIRFADTFANDPRRPAVLLKAAQDTLALGNHAQAAELAGRVVAENPNGKDALTRDAWAVIATARFALGDYLNAELASLQRLQLAPADDPDRNAHVERLAAAIYKQGEQARAAGRLKDAAEHFLRVSQIASQSSIAAAADFDAAATLNEALEWQQAIPVWEAFIKNHPQHELRPKALENLAQAYEQSGDWQSAANRYEDIYQNEKDPERKRALLWRSAELYDKGAEPAAAIRTYQRFVDAYPQPLEQATEARLRIADHYQRLGQATQRRTWLQRLVTAHKEPGVTDRTRFVAAHAALEIAEPEFDAFTRVKLVQPMKTNLKKKRDALQSAVDAYSRAADFGVAGVTTASLHRIGAIYHQFSRDLLNSERPKNLDAEALEEYDILLEEQAFPFEERAISVYENNARNAYTGIYDEWVKKSFEALRELLPIQYDKTEVIDDVMESFK